jgi:aminoglycoside phosphotransferase (APT) family kinase protein
MRPIDQVETLPLIARGGQADIYDFGNGKVLRVPRRPQDYDRIRYEYTVYSLLSDSDINAPKAYELVEVSKAPAIIMERISGISMMDQIKKRPFLIKRKAVQLAKMHVGILKQTANVSMTLGKEKAKFCINGSQNLTEEVKGKLLDALEHLPDGNYLCHGDFHPGNILNSDGKDYIIDWSGASRGDGISDIAHTYLLLTVVPRVPHVGFLMHALQKQLGKVMAGVYLRTIRKTISLNLAVFSRWVLIMAAERTYYGLPSEMKRLQVFILKYMKALSSGMKEDHLYKWI